MYPDQLSDYHYELPEELIATSPLDNRPDSRLLCLDRSQRAISHHVFKELIDYLEPEDCLVLNNTKVIPARLYGHKESGGKVECFVERILSNHEALAMIRASKSPKVGSRLRLSDAITAMVIGRQGEFFHLRFDESDSILNLLERHGDIPLPHYMARAPEAADKERYQTVFAESPGAVAAPTAGLHFDDALLGNIIATGVNVAKLTLHVGAGTFQPIRVDNLSEHKMHSEWMTISSSACEVIQSTQLKGGRVIAVGTTAVRSLETAARHGQIMPYEGETNLFIRPGYQFQCVDAMITNFHLPQSSLLMLVSAFAGYEFAKQAYEIAIENRYRFYSYGDAMFIC